MLRGIPFVCIAILVLLPPRAAQSRAPDKEARTATEIRLTAPGWWPTKGTASRQDYVGPEACAVCHSDKTEKQKNTPMARALMTANSAAAQVLANGPLEFRSGVYNYHLAQTEKGPVYSVSDDTQTLAVPLSWAFGNAEFGQTYIYERNGSFYESRLSYYPSLPGLDFTIGTPRSTPNKLDAALGRRLYPDDARQCFGCHSTAATTDNHFDTTHMIPGVTCEACHGPGAQHVRSMKTGYKDKTSTLIMNPALLAPTDSVEFCGACHRTSVDAALTGMTGIYTLRFPVYRLESSRCWGKGGDARLTCFMCHNPHQPLVRDAASYDRRCLSCHVATTADKPSADHPGLACRAGEKTLCVNCHMPKFSIPEMHSSFTDHKIAIHREGEAFKE